MTRRTVGGIALHVEAGGAGDAVLLFIHGIGATGAVWEKMLGGIDRHWTGRWLAPDLRGHGRSDHAAHYGILNHAADCAALVADAKSVSIIGHSMGGFVAVALMTGWFGVLPKGAVALAIKLRWTDEERARGRAYAAAPVRRFDTREEALGRYLRVSGLEGHVDPRSAAATSGIAAMDGGWRLAQDPRTISAGDTPLAPFLAARKGPVIMGCGDQDPIVAIDELRAHDPGAIVLAGARHNAHAERPDAVWSLFETLRESGGA